MVIHAPYLLFIGDATDALSIKMAQSVAHWRPDLCVGEFSVEGCTVSTGLPKLSIEEAAKKGAKTLVLGFANSGGILDKKWLPLIELAIRKGMHIVSGLHQKLTSYPELVHCAQQYDVELLDIRHPTTQFNTGTGRKRSGKRLLTVGTDCSVGKMYTSLSLEQAMSKQNMDVDFRATGQCGILVAGAGIAIDCVVADFISGAAESCLLYTSPSPRDRG